MKKRFTTRRIVFIAVMAACVCVATFIRFPLLGSKVHLGNICCLLSGFLLGPLGGGLAAGIGSALNDTVSGYGLDEVLITFITKGAMAVVCGLLAGKGGKKQTILAGICGAWSYVVLYMAKTLLYRRFVYGYPWDAVWATMLSKLPASAINAVFAMVCAPLLYAALKPRLEKSGIQLR